MPNDMLNDAQTKLFVLFKTFLCCFRSIRFCDYQIHHLRKRAAFIGKVDLRMKSEEFLILLQNVKKV